jgi:hypothetical protein
MRHLPWILALAGLLTSCRRETKELGHSPSPEEVRLRARAEQFLRDVLSTTTPGAQVEKLEKGVQYRIGDLFNAGHDVCVAAFMREKTIGKYTFKHSFGPVFFSRKTGKWKLRSCFLDEGSPFKVAFGLRDMSNDDVPEVVFYEGFGATGNTSEHIYKYSEKSDSLVCAAQGLSRPRSFQGKIWTSSKAGWLCDAWAEYEWHGNRLLKRRSGGQWVGGGQYVVGPGTDTASIWHTEHDLDGKITYSWRIVGNLPAYNRLEDLPDDMRESLDRIVLHMRIGRRRRRVRVKVDVRKAEAKGLEPAHKEWVWMILDAVIKKPEVFTADTKCGTSGLKVSDFAAVDIVDDFQGIATYECHHLLDDDVKKLPALSSPLTATVSTRAPRREDKPLPLSARTAAHLLIRGPDIKVRSGTLTPRLGKLFVVRSVRTAKRTFHVDCEVRPSRVNVSHWSNKTFRPTVELNLGKLRPGTYRAAVTIRKDKKPDRRIEHAFKVRR